jgi:hypothetical protein
VSDSERLEPIRTEIDEARAATDRFRAKATELIADLREREAAARRDAVIACAAAQEARERAQEAIEHAKRLEARATAKARVGGRRLRTF